MYKYDVGGLSHSTNGVDGPYTVVMPMAGALDLSAFPIRGLIDGNMIKEGTITLGSDFNTDYIDNKIDELYKRVTEEREFSEEKILNLSKDLYTTNISLANRARIRPVSDGFNIEI